MKKYCLSVVAAIGILVVGGLVGVKFGYERGLSEKREELANQTLFFLSFSASQLAKMESDMDDKVIADHATLLENSLQTAIRLHAEKNPMMTDAKGVASMKRAATFIRERPALFAERMVVEFSERAILENLNHGTELPDLTERHNDAIDQILTYVDSLPAP